MTAAETSGIPAEVLREPRRKVSIGPITRDRRRVLVQLAGDLDGATAARLQSALDVVIDPDIDRIIFDLDRVTFLDSSGINLLLTLRQDLLHRDQQPVQVINAHGVTARVLEITGIDALLVHDDSASGRIPPVETA
ncbi:MAG: Anti-sigma factor antagonist [Acidimicrobiales bacterium]|nr:Anti-sigma factor antagonist [Acidimicrobiales bacterium]